MKLTDIVRKTKTLAVSTSIATLSLYGAYSMVQDIKSIYAQERLNSTFAYSKQATTITNNNGVVYEKTTSEYLRPLDLTPQQNKLYKDFYRVRGMDDKEERSRNTN